MTAKKHLHYLHNLHLSRRYIDKQSACKTERESESERESGRGESVCAHREREAWRKEKRECHFGVKLSLLRLAHSLINTDNEMFSAA